MISLSANWRTISVIACCSSVFSWYVAVATAMSPLAAGRAEGYLVRNTGQVASNLEIAGRVAEALPDGDWASRLGDEQALARIHEAFSENAWPDVEIVMTAPGGLTSTFYGPDGYREAWEDWLAPFASYEVE